MNKKEMLYVVTFLVTETQKTKPFFVNCGCYEKMELNAKRTLVYHGKKLLSFQGISGESAAQSRDGGMQFVTMNKKL